MCHRASIIHHGRLIAEGTIDELLSRYGTGGFTIRVGEPEQGAAVEALTSAGLTASAQPGDDERVVASGDIADGSAISRALADRGIYVGELVPHNASLEEVFLTLTDDTPADAPMEVAA
jgi:ABC-type multidrug transport system ATPase subunit